MESKQLLMEGLVDALGFVSGAMLGYGLCLLLGLNIFEPGYSNSSIIGIGLLGLGGGLGLQVARRLRAAWLANEEKQKADE